MTVGVAVMAYGTPRSPDDVEAYYTHIRRGRPPSPEQLADLVSRYEAVGGISTMARRTRAQVDAIAAALDDLAPGRFRVALGQKHSHPFVEDAASELVGADCEAVVGLVLAPHFSGASVGEYQRRLRDAVAAVAGQAGTAGSSPTGAGAAVPVAGIERWSDEEAWLDFQADAVREALATMPAKTKVLFTAHSLPERVLAGDSYPAELAASARAIATRAGLATWAGWGTAWQSAGATPEPWRGPDVLEVIGDLADTGRSEGVLVCAQGFVTDHLEVAYDLDVQAREVAEARALTFARTRTVDADPAVMAALARLVADTAASLTERDTGGQGRTVGGAGSSDEV